MDPDAALRGVAAHLRAAEHAEALALLEGYWAWRRSGGFEPPGDARARRLAQRVAGRQFREEDSASDVDDPAREE